MSKRPVAVLLAVLAAVTLAACTNDNASSDSGGTTSPPEKVLKAPDPCGLVTVPDAERALGGPVQQPPQPGAAGDVKTCVWRPVGARDPKLGLTIAVTTSPSQKDAQSVFNAAKQGGQEVTGIGDAAYRNGPQKMTVRVANVVVGVDAGDISDPTIAPRVETVSRTVVTRL